MNIVLAQCIMFERAFPCSHEYVKTAIYRGMYYAVCQNISVCISLHVSLALHVPLDMNKEDYAENVSTMQSLR